MVLDSSCWLEYFADTDRADLFASAIEHTEQLVVPVLTVYEVVKKLVRESGDGVASAALSLMQRGRIVPIDLPLAMLGAVDGLPLADSLIYATAQSHAAQLWTQDSHFETCLVCATFRNRKASIKRPGAQAATVCRTARSQAPINSAARSRDSAGSKRRSACHCADSWSRPRYTPVARPAR